MSHILFCIQHDVVERRVRSGDTALDYCASNQLPKMAVGRGDTIWVVDCPGTATLRLLGRIRVDRVVDRETAKRALGREHLYPRDWVVIPAEGPIDHIIPLDISEHAAALRFQGGSDRLPAGFTGQHLQSLRRLTPEAGAFLQELWGKART